MGRSDMNQTPPADGAVTASREVVAGARRREGAAASGERQLLSELAAEVRDLAAERWRSYYIARAALPEPTITVTPRQFGFSVIFQVDLQFPNGGGSECFMVKIRRQQRAGSFVQEEMTDRTLALSRA